MKSTDGGETWSEPQHFGVAGKNASLHLSPAGIPLLLCSPVEGEDRPGRVYYSLDSGESWQEGMRVVEPIAGPTSFAYCINAVNLGNGRMLVVFYGTDPDKPETGGSPWSHTQTYIGANLVQERVVREDRPQM